MELRKGQSPRRQRVTGVSLTKQRNQDLADLERFEG